MPANARLTDYQDALLHALAEVVEQCENVELAYSNRADDAPYLTMNEAQEIAVLRIRLDDLADVQATRGTEAR
jgi:hypothetical protein